MYPSLPFATWAIQATNLCSWVQFGIDPANAGTSIQVLMDILGVAITCVCCQLVLVQFAGGLPGIG
eukprot:553449-Pelagomonas_calceolata.AAC.2